MQMFKQRMKTPPCRRSRHGTFSVWTCAQELCGQQAKVSQLQQSDMTPWNGYRLSNEFITTKNGIFWMGKSSMNNTWIDELPIEMSWNVHLWGFRHCHVGPEWSPRIPCAQRFAVVAWVCMVTFLSTRNGWWNSKSWLFAVLSHAKITPQMAFLSWFI